MLSKKAYLELLLMADHFDNVGLQSISNKIDNIIIKESGGKYGESTINIAKLIESFKNIIIQSDNEFINVKSWPIIEEMLDQALISFYDPTGGKHIAPLDIKPKDMSDDQFSMAQAYADLTRDIIEIKEIFNSEVQMSSQEKINLEVALKEAFIGLENVKKRIAELSNRDANIIMEYTQTILNTFQ